MNDNSADIITLPPPEPQNHRRMSMMARAAQFAPFAALTRQLILTDGTTIDIVSIIALSITD